MPLTKPVNDNPEEQINNQAEEVVSPPAPAVKNSASRISPRAVIIICLCLVLITLATFAVFYFLKLQKTTASPVQTGIIRPDWGKVSQDAKSDEQGTIASPINGLLYTEEQAKVWQNRRPMAVMVNNHVEARPYQAGLAEADLIYEAVAEGGIPRLLAIYHSQTPDKVGSIRSARVYYVDWAREYDAWYAHWGGAQIDPNDPAVCNPAADAFAHMRQIFVSSLDEYIIGESAYWRESKPNLATEHTGYASVPKLYQAGYDLYPDQKKEYRPVESWQFKEDSLKDKRPEKMSFSFNFWDDPDYAVIWEYDPTANVYRRRQGGQPHLDSVTKKQLEAKNVIVVFMPETKFFDKKAHLQYGTLGKGEARIFLDGQVIEAKWVRPTAEDRTKFYDLKGKEIGFNRGPVWIEVLPLEQTVTVNQ